MLHKLSNPKIFLALATVLVISTSSGLFIPHVSAVGSNVYDEIISDREKKYETLNQITCEEYEMLGDISFEEWQKLRNAGINTESLSNRCDSEHVTNRFNQITEELKNKEQEQEQQGADNGENPVTSAPTEDAYSGLLVGLFFGFLTGLGFLFKFLDSFIKNRICKHCKRKSQKGAEHCKSCGEKIDRTKSGKFFKIYVSILTILIILAVSGMILTPLFY